jgi:hypothetical protein
VTRSSVVLAVAPLKRGQAGQLPWLPEGKVRGENCSCAVHEGSWGWVSGELRMPELQGGY